MDDQAQVQKTDLGNVDEIPLWWDMTEEQRRFYKYGQAATFETMKRIAASAEEQRLVGYARSHIEQAQARNDELRMQRPPVPASPPDAAPTVKECWDLHCKIVNEGGHSAKAQRDGIAAVRALCLRAPTQERETVLDDLLDDCDALTYTSTMSGKEVRQFDEDFIAQCRAALTRLRTPPHVEGD